MSWQTSIQDHFSTKIISVLKVTINFYHYLTPIYPFPNRKLIFLPNLRHCYAHNAQSVATNFTHGRVANDSKFRETVWRTWFRYFRPFKIGLQLQEQKLSWDWMCFLISGFAAEVRSVNCDFGRDVKVLTVFKAVPSINKTIHMASNRIIGPLKLSEKNR